MAKAAAREEPGTARMTGAMYPGEYACTMPDRAAAIRADTGEALTYRDLDDRSNRLAQFLHAQGLRRGDYMALLMEKRLEYFVIMWAAIRSGLYITAINRYRTADEAAYIVNDCAAQVLITSIDRAEVAVPLAGLIPNCRTRLMLGGTALGHDAFEIALALPAHWQALQGCIARSLPASQERIMKEACFLKKKNQKNFIR